MPTKQEGPETWIRFLGIFQDSNKDSGLDLWPRPKQLMALKAAVERDTLAVLATGYGKTTLIRWLPYTSKDGCVIVISPLNAIIIELEKVFGNRVVVVKSGSQLQSIPTSVRYLIGHPEALTGSEVKARLRSDPDLCARISHIVIDEAHCVLSWGQSLFRPAYLEIGILRATVNSGKKRVKMVGLTATATPEAQQQIAQTLRMKSYKIITTTPDRPNIYLEVKRRAATNSTSRFDALEDTVSPYLRELVEKGTSTPKTIMYAPLQACGHIHNLAMKNYLKGHPNCPQSEPEKSDEIASIIQQFHAPQTLEMKSRISTSMLRQDGNLRLLLATEAYSMGADPPDVERVVHISPPKSLEVYVQEIGRCARDGRVGTATCFMNNADLGGRHITTTMKTFLTTKDCRRKTLLSHYNYDSDPKPTRCCDNCSSKDAPSNVTGDQQKPPRIDKDQLGILVSALDQYFQAENGLVSEHPPDGVTGLSSRTLRLISQNAPRYKKASFLEEDFPCIEQVYRENIVAIITSCLSLEIDSDDEEIGLASLQIETE